jgi:hypothetical protein
MNIAMPEPGFREAALAEPVTTLPSSTRCVPRLWHGSLDHRRGHPRRWRVDCSLRPAGVNALFGRDL